jgi:hypothetical protein
MSNREADEQAQYFKQMSSDLDSLNNNPAFKRVIIDGYLRDRAANVTSMLSTAHVKKAGTRNELFEVLVGISGFQQYLLTIHAMGAQVDDEETGFEDLDESIASPAGS